MGVFKWLRRERVTVTTRQAVSPATPIPENSHSETQVGTIRTEEYKRDLAEFQARRSLGNKELQDTPVKKKCARHSLPVSCTDCGIDHDNTFNYEKKSAVKYKRKSQQRSHSANSDEKVHEGVPNIQFLFQNQVFMPGNMFATSTYSEPQKAKRQSRQRPPHKSPTESDLIVKKHIDFNEDEEQSRSPPFFYKNNSLPFDIKNFLDGSKSDDDEVDGLKAAGDVKLSSQSSGSLHKDGSKEDKLWEVMSELKNLDQWADEQLQVQSPCTSKSEDNNSDTSVYGLPIASVSDIDVTMEKNKIWNNGKWGVVTVQIKKLAGVTVEHVRKKKNTEINILRKCRHPNIILLMGLYPDIHNNVHLICESFVDSLFNVLHVKGRILSVQTAVRYALDIANALVFLRMQGYIHTELSSASVMITANDAIKLADLGPCAKLPTNKDTRDKNYEVYESEPQYVNIEDSRESNSLDCEPLISTHASETYIANNTVAKKYTVYRNSDQYRWLAPELFEPDDKGMVYPCSRSDVYSLCLILWESCNAILPFKDYSYGKLKEHYTLWKTGVSLPADGTYPGCLLSLLKQGLKIARTERLDLPSLYTNLYKVRNKLDNLEYIVIPAKLKKKSDFSSVAWGTVSPTDSEYLSPVKENIQHKAMVHNNDNSSTDSSEKDCSKSDTSPLYEIIPKENKSAKCEVPQKCYISDDDITDSKRPILKYDHLSDKNFSSACSTPIAKIKTKIKDIGTPGALQRSDSTEYCSILSPDNRYNFGFNDESVKDQNSTERPTAKLSRSFTPKSYKPLHIKVPEFNLESLKALPRDQNGNRSSYNFDIKNYSLPTTPIARSNKLRKNAWLSGELNVMHKSSENLKEGSTGVLNKQESKKMQSAPETPVVSAGSDRLAESGDVKGSFIGLRKTDHSQDFLSPENEDITNERTNSWSLKSPKDRNTSNNKHKIDEDILANLNVKPLVAIHERWIYEANRKTGRSMSLPDDNRSQTTAVKPASHCVDTLQKSLPQLNTKKTMTKIYRGQPASPNSARNGIQWEQFCQAREAITKNINFTARDPERFHIRKKDNTARVTADEETCIVESKVDQATDTKSIEEFIRDMIRKEFHCLIHELSDDSSTSVPCNRNEEIINKGVANILENLKSGEEPDQRKENIKSFSRVKINGNNKPLLQITFSRSGENSLQVLDNCVNVTICDANSSGRDKLNQSMQSMEDALTPEDFHVNSLKRCQAFNAIQEARSTEDLYIDDDLSTQMQENFGGKVKLIPLHGSLHEILCEKEDDCCLIKVKQENGCDTIYFRCDNSDTDSRDAIDGCRHESRAQDTVVFKRSISLIEERIQRIVPKDKQKAPSKQVPRKETTAKMRPKSEIFSTNINKESRVLSNSSPSLAMNDEKEGVEVNIENVMCYQDSSSDECLKCQTDNDDFELLEKKIEEDLANSNMSSLTCGCLEKISEENLSIINEEVNEKDRPSLDSDDNILD